jgi:hypothetical protein
MKLIRVTAVISLSICASMVAANDLHPIVEVQSGYLFGAASDGKWLKAEESARSVKANTTYQIYSLTARLGEAKGSAPKSVDEPCPDTMEVTLSQKPESGVIALAAPWNALPRKPRIADTTQQVYVDAVRDFLKTKGIEQPKVKIDSILRVDLDGDGEDEVLISATNYFRKDESVPMRSPAGSYSMVVLRRMAQEKWKRSLSRVNSTRRLMSGGKTRSTRRMRTKSSPFWIWTATAKWKSSSARAITKVKRSQFTVATRKKLRLYFLFLVARDINDRCEKDSGIRGHSGW